MRQIYWLFAFVGVMAVPAAFIAGFRYDAAAPIENTWFNIEIYAAYIAVHLIMTRGWFKKAFFGKAGGSTGERRIYVIISIVTWLAVYYYHQPMGGLAYDSPAWLQFAGLCVVLLGIFSFFEGATFGALGGLFGVHGSDLSHTHGGETKLFTEGSYASVRHPMYRGACIYLAASLLIYPNASQALFALMTAISFVGFIPLEEKQLLAARGDEYRAYMEKTPYRVIPGIW